VPVRLPASLAPLRHRQFAGFWAAAFVSNIGTWMESVSVGAYVTDVTDQALWAGLVAAAAFLPTGLMGPIGGAMADRFDRRRILLASNALNLLVAGVLTALFATGEPAPGVVTGLVLLAGLSFAFGFPSYQALLPDLVPREDLVGAMGLSSAQWNLGRVIGPALAGLVWRGRWASTPPPSLLPWSCWCGSRSRSVRRMTGCGSSVRSRPGHASRGTSLACASRCS
jgi:MFS family permease